MSTILFLVQTFLKYCKKLFLALIKFIFPAIGSIIIEAIPPPLIALFTASILLYSMDIVFLALALVTPNESGVPNVDAPEPALIKKESPCP